MGIINSFSWEDYGYDPQTQNALRKGHRKLLPEAVILLHYDSTSQTWYYASQMNLYGMRVYERNNIAVLVAKDDDKYFNGRTYKTLYAQLTNSNNRPNTQMCAGFYVD